MNTSNKPTKSVDAFRTISEVAGELDLPQHVLRFWETKFSQVKPMKRGGGRRYYRPEDVALLRHVRSLLYDEGYTIKGVQKLLRQGGVNKAELLTRKSAQKSANRSAANTDDIASVKADNEAAKQSIRAAIDELETLRETLRDVQRTA